MSVNVAVDLLEWLGTFFLAIEAIKLRNLQSLRTYVQQLFYAADRALVTENKRANKIYNVLAPFVGFGFIVMVVYALGYDPLAMAGWWNHYFDSLPRPWNFLLAVVIGGTLYPVLAIAGYLVMVVPYFLILAAMTGLVVVEVNTENGIIGITGFGLFSIATLLKLIGH